MKPSIGRIVIVKDTRNPSNGTAEQPAIVTRVWGAGDPADNPGCGVRINATVFPDLAAPRHAPSISLFETEDEAKASGVMPCAWWPGRSPAIPANEMRPEGSAPPETEAFVGSKSPDGHGDVGSASAYGDSAEVG